MKTSSKILAALGAGLAIGGLLGVLFAPKKGKETREKLRDQGTKLKEQLDEKLKWGSKKVTQRFGEAHQQADELI